MRIRLVLMMCFLIALVPTYNGRGSFSFAQNAVLTETPTAIPTAEILMPLAGQAVQGRVPVLVYTAIQGFQSAELYFGYTDDQTGTWFLIAQNEEPLTGTEMTAWDTGLITDGNYNLRLVVLLQDGTKLNSMVGGIRVRNYSPIETSTPTPVIPSATLSPGELPTSTATPLPTTTPTPTPLPTNPAEMTDGQITNSLSRGALGAVFVFVVLGVYILIRQGGRKRNHYDGND